jgi:predicted Zn-dependent peptidase
LGIFVDVGSRDERTGERGCAHLLEHLAFRGAGSLDRQAIADRMDRLGADVNAFTTRDLTCYHAHVLERDVEAAWELLWAMAMSPWLTADDLERERGVVAEELREAEDDVEDRADQAFTEALWGRHPMARDILGTAESLSRMREGTVRGFHTRHYGANRLTVVLAGAGVDRLLDRVRRDVSMARLADPAPRIAPVATAAVRRRVVPGQEVYLSLGISAPVMGDPAENAWRLLGIILGGQNSSRLWQRIREQMGLAYQVSAQYSAWVDYADFTASVGVAADRVRETLAAMAEEWEGLVRHPVTALELERAKSQASTALVFGRETVEGVLHYLARWAAAGQEPPDPRELMSGLAQTPLEAVHAAAAQAVSRFASDVAVGIAGPRQAVRGDPRLHFHPQARLVQRREGAGKRGG